MDKEIMKKVIIVNLVVAALFIFLICGGVSSVSADVGTKQAHYSGEGSARVAYGTTYVQYAVSSSYDLIIPDNIIFNKQTLELVSKVNASSISLEDKQILNVTVQSHHGWKMVEHIQNPNWQDGNNIDDKLIAAADPGILRYTMTFDGDSGSVTVDTNNGKNPIVVLKVTQGQSSGETILTFNLLDTDNEKAGTYQDKLIFNARIDTVVNP